MTKISNQVVYIPDTEISGLDYLIGTDIDNANKTVSFRIEDLGSHFNMTNGSRNFDYLFYNHLGISQAPSDGCFYSNDNEQDPNNITHFFISKYTRNYKDVSTFFDSITNVNPFDLIISQKIGLNSIFFFSISDVESINGYYKLTVSEVFFPSGVNLQFEVSNTVFNLKSNIGASGVPFLRDDLVFTGSQTFTLLSNYSQVWSIDVTGQGALSPSQYTLIPPNQILINDTLDTGDYLVVLYSSAETGVLPYYTQNRVDELIASVGVGSVEKVAGESISSGMAVVVWTDGLVYKYNIGNINHAGISCGISKTSASVGGSITIVFAENKLTDVGSGWSAGNSYYIGSNGLLTTASPITGISKKIATGIDVDTIIINNYPEHILL